MNERDGTDPVALKALEMQTRDIYNRNAAAFDRQRPKGLHERKWLDRFMLNLRQGAAILDLGCGAGEPIASYFIAQNFRVTGVDFSHAMLEIARGRFPQSTWFLGDIRALDLGQQFDGIIGWNSFFHLPRSDQPPTLQRISKHLAPGGTLMLTVGPKSGEVMGHVNGEAVYHASLAPEEYAAILSECGIAIAEFAIEDRECALQTILLARKRVANESTSIGKA